MTHARLMRELSTREEAEWMAFFKLRELRDKRDRKSREVLNKVKHGRR